MNLPPVRQAPRTDAPSEPLATVAAATAETRIPTASGTGPNGQAPWTSRYILVVEDNTVNQELLAEMLMRMGCRVRLAGSAEIGLAALDEERFDLVMMDIQMPGMDGIAALNRFRQSQGGRTPTLTPVVAATANARPGEEALYLKHGFDDVLPKPVRQSQLLAVLTRQLPPGVDSAAGAALPEETAMPTAASAPMLDFQAIARLRELDPTGANQLLPRVISAYEKSLDRLLPDLQKARAPVLDLPGIRHVSHTLKSSSAALGALTLAERCAEIETLARTGQSDGLDALLDAMLSDLAQVRLALSALLTAP